MTLISGVSLKCTREVISPRVREQVVKKEVEGSHKANRYT